MFHWDMLVCVTEPLYSVHVTIKIVDYFTWSPCVTLISLTIKSYLLQAALSLIDMLFLINSLRVLYLMTWNKLIYRVSKKFCFNKKIKFFISECPHFLVKYDALDYLLFHLWWNPSRYFKSMPQSVKNNFGKFLSRIGAGCFIKIES